jgi:hypothetical protein
MATHSNGISALQRQLAFRSYETAWLLCAKVRRCMLAPGRSPLAGLVEVDETEIACGSKNDPITGGGGRSYQAKCWSSVPLRSRTAAAVRGASALARSPIIRLPAFMPCSLPISRQVPPPRPMVGADIPAPPA